MGMDPDAARWSDARSFECVGLNTEGIPHGHMGNDLDGSRRGGRDSNHIGEDDRVVDTPNGHQLQRYHTIHIAATPVHCE